MTDSNGATGGFSGSSPAGQAPTGLVASRVDPGRAPMKALAQVLLELRLSEQVFRQYGYQHLDKAEATQNDPREYSARMQKAQHNMERADCCKRALDFFESQGGIDAYTPAEANNGN